MENSRFYRITKAGKLMPAKTADEAIKKTLKDEFFWLHYIEPKPEDIFPLVEAIGINELSIEDVIDDNQLPKIDIFPENTFLLINDFSYYSGKLHVNEINLFLGKNFIVSIDRIGPNGKPVLGESIEGEVENAISLGRVAPEYALHAIIDAVVDRKLYAIEAIEDELTKAEDSLFEHRKGFSVKALQHIRRSLITLRKALFHEREILLKISRGDCPLISDKAIFHYRDIYDHITRYFELIETMRDIETSLMEIDISLRSNEMSRISNRTNRTLRRLTFISTIFLPLTLLASIGGMSEWSMMTGSQNWRFTYPLFIVGMAIIGMFSYRLLKWLAKRDDMKDEEDEDNGSV